MTDSTRFSILKLSLAASISAAALLGCQEDAKKVQHATASACPMCDAQSDKTVATASDAKGAAPAPATAAPTDSAKPSDSTTAADMAAAATKFLAALKDDQRAKATFEFTNEERLNWHFIPRPRKGLPLKEMTDDQRPLAQALLKTGLSEAGFAKAEQIRGLELVLRAMEGKDFRDPDLYYVSIFGTPDVTKTWGWRVEGHHFSSNFTIANGKIVNGTPLFMGDNPAKVPEGEKKGLRVLADEEDFGRAIVKALTDEQRKTATFDEKAPAEVITGPSRKADPGAPKGVAYKDLSPDVQKQISSLVTFYANRLRLDLANEDLAGIEKAGWDKVYFGWAGGYEVGDPHYYRIHGPTFLIEYDDTQNNANHIHTVWRDLANDFGEDILREHYDESKGDKEHGHDVK